MPLVRIDMIEGRSDEQLQLLLDTIQGCVVEAFGVPETDRYQIVHEHKPGRMVFLDTGLGFTRSDEVISVQFFTSPRTHVEKIKVYRLLSERLEHTCGLDPNDLLISVFTNREEDWSFARGEAQYVTGRLP
ncbi:Phenylpyruvate tautomerase PptA, 4-oxalocrotonate tautomerase family [Salipiger thiooxidans]|uniref:Phenylpyruvate tautomerase PptA, 4-oxalocrotonate tautomerase family n=1 Tax=Salipiger thiooxidans TaxID=282683 RepID=A0A1G7FEZ7_9RHOB|nr:tautomerase family protein [Salipiger thiooxidans]SDE74449.1 Phenylpyruvate tautomerase PptA, 4-oxalocrotonate tautomerase family [Salipiger thiooxidans]